MKLILILLILTVSLFYIFFSISKKEDYQYNRETPKIIHLIYIPWNKEQKLKDNYLDFDLTPYQKLEKNIPDYEIKLWTLPKIQDFVKEFYSEYYDIIFNVQRPVMIVDILRLLLVYHYGGIYLQYGSIPKVNIDMFLPSENKKVKLFTETIISTEFSKKMKSEPIRNGEPEELIRVYTGIFSAVPKHSYLMTLFTTSIENCKKYRVNRDYDILYMTGNAMMSTVYDKVGKELNDIELVDLNTTKKMLKMSSNGSWRTDK